MVSLILSESVRFHQLFQRGHSMLFDWNLIFGRLMDGIWFTAMWKFFKLICFFILFLEYHCNWSSKIACKIPTSKWFVIENFYLMMTWSKGLDLILAITKPLFSYYFTLRNFFFLVKFGRHSFSEKISNPLFWLTHLSSSSFLQIHSLFHPINSPSSLHFQNMEISISVKALVLTPNNLWESSLRIYRIK